MTRVHYSQLGLLDIDSTGVNIDQELINSYEELSKLNSYEELIKLIQWL